MEPFELSASPSTSVVWGMSQQNVAVKLQTCLADSWNFSRLSARLRMSWCWLSVHWISPVRVYLLTSSLLLIRRNKQLSFSSLHESQSRADRDCGDSDDSCEQPGTSDPFYSPREMVSSPLMSTPAGQGGLTDSVMCRLAVMWFFFFSRILPFSFSRVNLIGLFFFLHSNIVSK